MPGTRGTQASEEYAPGHGTLSKRDYLHHSRKLRGARADPNREHLAGHRSGVGEVDAEGKLGGGSGNGDHPRKCGDAHADGLFAGEVEGDWNRDHRGARWRVRPAGDDV